jgi:hypothetical protein
MEREYQLRKFTELRFEYYSAGRTLWFNDNMETAAILLGYAVELSLKQILVASENDGNRKLMNSHDVLELYKRADEAALKGAVSVTQDLLHFVTDRLHHRYPRQVEESAAKAQKRGHAICLALNVIAAYDDLIIGLDEWLRVNYPNEKTSLVVMAAHFVNRVTGRAVFHCNSAALRRTNIYKALISAEYNNAESEMQAQGLTPETIQYNLNNHKHRIDSWALAPDGLWVASHLTTAFGENFVETSQEILASNFKYPGHHIGQSDG